MSATLHTQITAYNGDANAINLHYSIVQRYKVQTYNTQPNAIKENGTFSVAALLHWDGKFMQTLHAGDVKERFPVLLSGIGTTKRLRILAIPYKSTEPAGNLFATASIKPLEEWSCKDCVKGMVFNSTASYTDIFLNNFFNIS